MDNVTTWADGHGRWHVEVPDTPRGLTKAVNALAHEINSREERDATLADVTTYVEQNIISLPTETPGRVHFAEHALD